MSSHSILVVDDEKIQRDSLAGFLRKKGYQSYQAPGAVHAVELIRRHTIDVVLTDYKMPGQTGMDLLRQVMEINPEIAVIMMTAYGNIGDAVEAMKAGAFDYLTKPVDLDELEILIRRATRLRQISRENRSLREALIDKHRFSNILSNSPLMEETLNVAARSAESRAAILIEGESGTGKELVARAIHFASSRRERPMVTVNCAALSEHLLESELFGHEKGAFTGAVAQKTGRVEEADHSTLFLDEVGDIPLTTQVKLLRFLQFGEFQRVGSNQTMKVDVRLIAATNRDLNAMIARGAFRDDFYYRLNVITIRIPPLRKRKEDIPMLIDYFIKKFSSENGKHIESISREALDALMKYDFPGNVRELENLVERAVVLARDSVLAPDDLPLHLSGKDPAASRNAPPHEYYTGSFSEKVSAFEIDLIQEALGRNSNNQTRAAEELGMTERNLRYKIKKYNLK